VKTRILLSGDAVAQRALESLRHAILEENERNISRALKNGAPTSGALWKTNGSAVHLAVKNLRFKSLQALIDHGVNVNVRAAREGKSAVTELLDTPSTESANPRRKKMLDLLAKHGLDPDQADDRNVAPIQRALARDDEFLFDCLVGLGSNVKVMTRDRHNLIHLAASSSNDNGDFANAVMDAWFEVHGNRDNGLQGFRLASPARWIRKLIDLGVDPDAQEHERGLTPAMIAAIGRNLEALGALLSSGVRLSTQARLSGAPKTLEYFCRSNPDAISLYHAEVAKRAIQGVFEASFPIEAGATRNQLR
jgi:ankyrin repeat protein